MWDLVRSIQKKLLPDKVNARLELTSSNVSTQQQPTSLSNAEKALLVKFLSPLQLPLRLNESSWASVLQKSIGVTVAGFKDKGLLVAGGVQDQLESLTVVDLKKLCVSHGIKAGSRKADIVNSLVGAATSMVLPSVLVCSSSGRSIAQRYKDQLTQDRIQTLQSTASELALRRFAEACKLVAKYESRQVFQRGIGIDWSNCDHLDSIKDLETIFSATPLILREMSSEELQTLRIAGALAMLFGEKEIRDYLPKPALWNHSIDTAAAARMFIFYARNQVQKEVSMRDYCTKQVEILTTSDCCEACKQLPKGKIATNKAPELPHALCTSSDGCRCMFVPVTKSFDAIVKGK